MSWLTVAVVVVVGGTGVALFYTALARGLKFREDFAAARRTPES